MEMPFLISQILMTMSIIIYTASFQLKDEKIFKLLAAIGIGLAGIHFMLLGAFAGAALALINAFRWFVSIFYKNKIILALFIIIMITAGVITYESVYSLLPVIASVIGTLGLFHDNILRTREYFFVVGVLWIIYNSVVFTPMGIVAEIFFLVSGYCAYKNIKQKSA